MKNKHPYENFPIWVPSLSCLLSLSIYLLGAYIFLQLGTLFSILYLLFCLWIEFRVLKESCVNCYYYDKVCALGRGKLCGLLFRKGNTREFVEREISWKSMLPDFLVFALPLIGGIICLIKDFSGLILLLLVMLTILSFGGNALMRGALACKYCKQRELGCPAEQLFSKSRGESK